MPKLIGDDGKPLSASAFRDLLREEANHILKPRQRVHVPVGPEMKARGRRRRAAQPIRAATEACCIYAVGATGHPIKVGIAADVRKRVGQLQVGQPHQLRILVTREVPAQHARSIELRAHAILAAKRMRGEWFNAALGETRAAIDQAIQEFAAAQA